MHRAAEQLQFIRDVMERSGTFTAVPGWGSIAMGLTAILGAGLAATQPTPERWLLVWLVCAGLAAGLGAGSLVRKARRSDEALFTGAGRKYALGLLPGFVAGAVLTAACWQHDLVELIPGIWLLLYGAATITGGAYSVRIVPLMGLAFMVVGTVTLFAPAAWADALLALGFGGLHVGFGWQIAHHHGG